MVKQHETTKPIYFLASSTFSCWCCSRSMLILPNHDIATHVPAKASVSSAALVGHRTIGSWSRFCELLVLHCFTFAENGKEMGPWGRPFTRDLRASGAEDDISVAVSSGKWCSTIASGCARGSHLSLVWAMLQAVLSAHHGFQFVVVTSQVCGFIWDVFEKMFNRCDHHGQHVVLMNVYVYTHV